MNAARAASGQRCAPSDPADRDCDAERAAERAGDRVQHRLGHLVRGERARDVVLVAGRERAADHGHAERAADLDCDAVGPASRSPPRPAGSTRALSPPPWASAAPRRSRRAASPGAGLRRSPRPSTRRRVHHNPPAIAARPAAAVTLLPSDADDAGSRAARRPRSEPPSEGSARRPEAVRSRDRTAAPGSARTGTRQREQSEQDRRGRGREARESGRTRASASDGRCAAPSQRMRRGVTSALIPASTHSREVQPRVGSLDDRPQQQTHADDREHARPTGSGRSAAGFRDSGTSRHAATTPTISNGTLTRNTEPHANLDSNRPPASGPSAIPTPIVPPHTPIARARSWASGNTLSRVDSPAGMRHRRAGPHHRPPGDQHSHRARQRGSERPGRERAKAGQQHRLRPRRSARLPATSNNPPNAIA